MPRIQGPTWQEIPLISAGSIPASQVGQTEPIFVGNCEDGLTVFVKASKDTKVYALVGPSSADCVYKLQAGTNVDTEDTGREWDCNNEAICFRVSEYIIYFSLVIVNEDASNAVEVTAWIA